MRLNSQLNKHITHLDLSFNKIGTEAIEELALFIEEKDCDLAYLNLEANCLGNTNIGSVCSSISKSIPEKIKYLNFAQNNLNDQSSLSISQMVELCTNLQVLILYFNQFKNTGAAMIVNKIKKHVEMRVFDISWNLIGSNLQEYPTREELTKINKNSNSEFNNAELTELKCSMEFNSKKKLSPLKNEVSKFAKELGEMFKEQYCDLIHLDISHNNIGYVDAEHISNEVKANHLILGIHVDGNEMIIDELGFISAIEKAKFNQSHFANSQIYYKIDRDHPLIKSNVLNIKKIRAKNNCWICEGWREIRFFYKPTHFEGTLQQQNVKLHLNFDNYKPFDTVLRGDQFVCHRMCPPGELMFYFTVNGVPADNYSNIQHKLKEAIIHVISKILLLI
jgi:hypothetical protein